MDPKNSELELSLAAEYGVEFVRSAIQGMKLTVLTGAGISTDSGIPDYRGLGKTPKHPMTFDVFTGSFEAQQRYWARSFVGWARISLAIPNKGHMAIARAERDNIITSVVTQNVDGLHQAAGSKNVIDLHGRLDRVICMACSVTVSREAVEKQLRQLNPDFGQQMEVEFTPDGDAEVSYSPEFRIPYCLDCSGALKPDVVFFGENVRSELVEKAMHAVDASDALLVAGTSLAVNSGLRFVRRAAKASKPIVIVNLGPTKGDEFALAKIEAGTSQVLDRLFQ